MKQACPKCGYTFGRYELNDRAPSIGRYCPNCGSALTKNPIKVRRVELYGSLFILAALGVSIFTTITVLSRTQEVVGTLLGLGLAMIGLLLPVMNLSGPYEADPAGQAKDAEPRKGACPNCGGKVRYRFLTLEVRKKTTAIPCPHCHVPLAATPTKLRIVWQLLFAVLVPLSIIGYVGLWQAHELMNLLLGFGIVYVIGLQGLASQDTYTATDAIRSQDLLNQDPEWVAKHS